MDVPLRRSELREGLTVSCLGDDEDILDWGRPPVVGTIRSGHPGRVTETHHGQHVLVAWHGLEDADISQGVGFSADVTGEHYLGLGVIDEDEYQRRVQRLSTGW